MKNSTGIATVIGFPESSIDFLIGKPQKAGQM